MRNTRFTLLLTLLFLASMAVLSGCAPRAGAGEGSDQAGDSGIVVDLPAIVIEYGADGSPSMGGIPLSQFSALIPPEMAAQLMLDQGLIERLQSFNIQNLQINNRAEGLDLVVNGLQMPSLSWNADSLASMVNFAGTLGQEIPALEQVLPLLTDMGLAAVVRFPAAEGAEEAPLMAESTTAADAEAAQAAFVDQVGTPPLINIPIFYNEDGTLSIAGMSQEELSALVGQPLDALALSPQIMAGLAAAGISQATISSGPDGVQIMVNDTALPALSWGDGRIKNLLGLLVKSGSLGGEGTDTEALMAVVDQLLPAIQTTDLSIHIFFPQ